MKVVQFARYGVPHEVCACVEMEDPGAPAADEVVIAIEAAPINPADLLIIEGRYPGPAELPAPLGIEGVGRVVAAGSGVTELAAGDRVMSLARANWAERITIKAAQAIKLPADLDVLQAAMMKANPATALLMLRDYVDLEAGDWIIQNAANSAVGQHVIRLAKARGIHTVNVVRRDSLVEPLKGIGADLVVVDGDDLAARVRDRSGGAKLAIDAIGGEATLRLADCLADGGTVVNYGFLSGQPCMITPHQAIVHGVTLKGFWLAGLFRTAAPERIRAIYAEVARHLADGTLAAPVEATYDIADIKDALAHAEREGRDGKILITPNGPVG
ncbi:MAG: zinc-dependent alcohol dehydrogenase family protein [Rhodospirillales bacterium]|nr:zinc-dependent alcohol dehydrogenase family protein [Rhodospirillales bacterium]MDH3792105.1 zinc-dependent alcohol dehydrogenase family protein [Rhodospirillales bacterium]MDH3912446.1 zinc-dependent alcohol dehydrogenase family protein [Rhodospirillales bacterium]MDH3917987.1 zinc-dependent alcohol dehydrogenase family protein [Rhodospirillales bacterium]MDH3965826.1 zinc-dependent alcohol dehydrogenase family protein [Rhodospirillales bacterium]